MQQEAAIRDQCLAPPSPYGSTQLQAKEKRFPSQMLMSGVGALELVEAQSTTSDQSHNRTHATRDRSSVLQLRASARYRCGWRKRRGRRRRKRLRTVSEGNECSPTCFWGSRTCHFNKLKRRAYDGGGVRNHAAISDSCSSA